MKTLLFLAAALCCLLSPLHAEAAGVAPSAEVVSSEKIRQKIRVGEVYTFYLDANPTTGYWWLRLDEELTDSASGVEVVSVSHTYLAPEPPAGSLLAGTPGKEKVTLAAINPGSFHLVLVYARPWERPLKPVRRVVVQVEVVP